MPNFGVCEPLKTGLPVKFETRREILSVSVLYPAWRNFNALGKRFAQTFRASVAKAEAVTAWANETGLMKLGQRRTPHAAKALWANGKA